MFQHASQKYAAGRTGTLAALGLGLILSPAATEAALINEDFATDTREDWTGINIDPTSPQSQYFAYTGTEEDPQQHEGIGEAGRLYGYTGHAVFDGRDAFTRTDGVAHTVLFQEFSETDISAYELTRSVHYNAGGFPTDAHFTRLAVRFDDGTGEQWAIGDEDLWTTKRNVGDNPWDVDGVIADPTTTAVTALADTWTLLDPEDNYAPNGTVDASTVLQNANAAGVYFRNEGGGWDQGYTLDEFILIPEPASLALLGLGGLVLLGRRRSN